MTKYAFLILLVGLLAVGCESDRRTGGVVDTGAGTGTDAGTMLDTGTVDPDTSTMPPTVRDTIPENLQAICDAVDPGFIEACDVEREFVVIPPETPRPGRMALFPGIPDPYNMNGWEWWQKWPTGLNPTYEESEATDMGMRCSVASALRYAAIMQDVPEGITRLLAETTWEGRFFNWNDDYSDLYAQGEPDGSVLWAWEWYLIKWISQTDRDGNCYLPTRAMLESAAENCLATAASAGGVIQGCQN